jgi:homoserine dehydrogenase
MNQKPVGVAVLGLGNVGSQVVRIIGESADDLTARIGAPLVLRGIGVRRVADDRGVPVDLLTSDVEELVSRDDVDIVVEVMGPVEPARKAILSALEKGKSVVTANKALMAQSTGELAQAAEHAHVDLYFEAAVAGAIPVIRPLTQSLAGDTVLRVAGIVNGTTNYILSEMDSTGAEYSEALADASALGYAEADPTADVEGYDAAAKAAILASIAFHTRVTADDVYREGITKVTPADFVTARALGCTIKLLSICERLGSRVSGACAFDASPCLGQRSVQRCRGGGRGGRAADVLRTGRRGSADGIGCDGRSGDGGAQPCAGRARAT